MGVFATNQNRHVYVATDYVDGTTKTALTAAGDIAVKTIGAGNELQLYFQYMNKKNEVIKSDYIPLKNLNYSKAFRAADLVTPLTKKEVTIAAAALDNSNPIPGQDYLLRITFFQWIGTSQYDQYIKDAAVHVTSGMSKSDFYKKMVQELNLAFSREVGATTSTNPYLDFAVDNTTTATKIIITEKPQAYSTGTESRQRVMFEVQPTTIYAGGDDIIWGEVADATLAKYTYDSTNERWIPNSSIVVGTNAMGNGPDIADLEYFSLGERGDQYRNMGWPNVVITEGLANASLQYNVIELHFAFKDEGVNDYRSEKDITIAVPLGASGSEYTKVNGIIGKINTAAGSTIIATLS